MMWNVEKYKRILTEIVKHGSFKGIPVKSKEELYYIIGNKINIGYHAVKSWARATSTGPGHDELLRDLEKLLETKLTTEESLKRGNVMNVRYSDFVKANIKKAYELMIDYINSAEVESELVYCEMRFELRKLKVGIPEDVYTEILAVANKYLDPIIYDSENFFAELYSEELGSFDENNFFHVKNDEAAFKSKRLYFDKITEVEKKIEEFAMERLYPLLMA